MEQSALLLASELRALGFEVEVLSLNTLGPLGPLLQEQGIPARSIAYRGFAGWRSFLPLRRVIRSVDADAMIMIGHNLMAMLATSGRWHRHKILSMHFHHVGVKPNWAWRIIYALAVRQFRSIVFPSRFIFDEACRIAPFIRSVSCIISYPFLTPRHRTEEDILAARGRLGLRPQAKVVGNAGWLIPRKRWDVFLEVAAQVAECVPEAEFLIAGDGPERQALTEQAQRLDIAGRVHWLGWTKDLADFYLALDAMLFNSDFDAMGRTPLEAMSFGIPAVASVTQCGLPEVIDTDEVGFLLRSHDVPRLADKVVELLRDEPAARALGARGRQRIEDIGNPHEHALRVLQALGLEVPPARATGVGGT